MKYEYLTLQSFSHANPGCFTCLKPTGAYGITGNNVTDAMNALGKEGWELVSSASTEAEGLLLFFKRALI